MFKVEISPLNDNELEPVLAPNLNDDFNAKSLDYDGHCHQIRSKCMVRHDDYPIGTFFSTIPALFHTSSASIFIAEDDGKKKIIIQ